MVVPGLTLLYFGIAHLLLNVSEHGALGLCVVGRRLSARRPHYTTTGRQSAQRRIHLLESPGGRQISPTKFLELVECYILAICVFGTIPRIIGRETNVVPLHFT